MQSFVIRGTVCTMETQTLLGYHVKAQNGEFVHEATDHGDTWAHYDEPEPCTLAQAYSRIGRFLADYPREQAPEIVPVHRALTPLETASSELGSLLTSLCERHGLNLGLTQEQINRRITQELAELGASGVKTIAANPVRR